jgi:hypothetical protein
MKWAKVFKLWLVFNFLFNTTSGQEIEWQKSIGGDLYEYFNSVIQTSDNGYLIGGESISPVSGDKTEPTFGNGDYWIVKTDQTGNIEWDETIGGTGSDECTIVIQSNDGGFLIGGGSDSPVSFDKTEGSLGGMDYWIVKIDALGSTQWQHTIGGSADDYLFTMHQTFDGGYILGGVSESNISGDKSENCLGFWDYWIVKVDSLGNIQWDNTIGGNDWDRLYSIQQTADGGYILGGDSESAASADKSENSTDTDYWLVKCNSNGAIVWENTIGGNSSDYLKSTTTLSDGSYVIGGHSYSSISGDKTEDNQGYFDYWILKIDSIGNIIWQNTFGGDELDQCYSTLPTSDGGYIVIGDTRSPISGDKTENNVGSADSWVVKLDSTGKIQWQNTIGGVAVEHSQKIFTTSDGGFIMGCYSQSDVSGDKTDPSNGGSDYWIIKITEGFNSITGNIFSDLNSDGVQNNNDLPLNGKKLKEINSGRISFSQNDGSYKINVIDTGFFWVSSEPLNYYISNPLNHNAFFPAFDLTDSLNDFAFQPLALINDLCITITPLGLFRAGMNGHYNISFVNVGTTTINFPTVIFYPDDSIYYVTSSIIPSLITPDSIMWNVGTLDPFQEAKIIVTVNVNTGVSGGTTINSGVKIEPLAGDANVNCNTNFREVIVTASQDPNDILVDIDTLYSNQFPASPELNYLIRFQNTGNDTAFFVSILNPIDTSKLDINTFNLTSASHPVNINFIYHESNLEFSFPGILLPDSIMDEKSSHGFVGYSIYPKSNLTVNDSIINYAAIYFDFNAPVITNIATTHIVLPTFINENASTDQMVLYPNPANSTLNIETGNVSTLKSLLIISDVTGRTMLSKSYSPNSTKHNVDISSFASGVYIVQLKEGERISRGRFVKD